jgi:poly(3-hydroxybutyrate) depolymerase
MKHREASMKLENHISSMVALVMLFGGACFTSGGGGGTSGSGGAIGSGGTTSSGGSVATGGTTSTGGSTATGGTTSTGGQVETGGSTTVGSEGGAGSGGTSTATTASGGRVGTGGAETGGTTSGTGGRGSGGVTAQTGGTTGRGGAATGGRPGTGGTTGGLGGTNTGGQATGGTTGAGGESAKSDGCGKTPTLKSGSGLSISVSGTSRTYNLKVPDPYDNNNAYRLIMSYHWLGGTADNVSNGSVAKPYYGLWDLAGGSTIFVAPQGTGNAWSNSGGVDVEFSRQLITLIESEFCIDKSRIFCEGFSMGGSMSYAMACGMGDVIRAVAVHSGGTMSGCAKHDKPVAYFMTHGTKDSVCTYPSFALPPLMDFAKMNGCTNPDPTLSQTAFEALLPEPTSTAGACMDFEGCKEGYPVRACLFVGDHTPSPDGTNGWVPKESWKFFSQF